CCASFARRPRRVHSHASNTRSCTVTSPVLLSVGWSFKVFLLSSGGFEGGALLVGWRRFRLSGVSLAGGELQQVQVAAGVVDRGAVRARTGDRQTEYALGLHVEPARSLGDTHGEDRLRHRLLHFVEIAHVMPSSLWETCTGLFST